MPISRTTPEASFQRMLITQAKARGWMVVHFKPALDRAGRWATHMDGHPGFPDLVLARGGRVLLWELKDSTKNPTAAQKAWLAAAGAHARLCRPCDYDDLIKELDAA